VSKKEDLPSQMLNVADDAVFRRQAGLQILGAYVARHGGFNPAERDVLMRMVWEYADLFVAMEHAAPLAPEPVQTPEERHALRARTGPTDEWAVIDGEKRTRGFVIPEEAEYYASARPGARVIKISGEGVPSATAPA